MAESQFGKFTLVRKIASGGMGEVFLARQQGPEGFEKFLVVKRILSHHTDNADYVDMFFAEARLAAKMSHSNIVQIFDMGEIQGSYYIAMEFVHGKSIKDIIDASRARNLPIPPAHTAEIVGKLCSGMAYAHSLTDVSSGQVFNIIHRDINPHNVLVSYGGEAKIIDFGIAKSEMNEHKTETGTIKGKFVYMSPEQSAAEKIDKRSDIFSIGIVLYEMLSGENPFQKANIVLSLDAIQRFTPPPPSTINPDFKAFDAIIEKALAKKPDERYQDASEMQLALQRAVILGDIAPPQKPLGAYMTELFKESIEKEQKFMKDSRRDMPNTPIGDMTPRPQRAPAGPQQRPIELDHTPPPTPLPIHQTGSRSGVTQIRRRRRKLVMSIVASILLAAAVSVALILINVPGSQKPPTTTSVVVDEPKVPKFIEPQPSVGVTPTPPPVAASAPVAAAVVEPQRPSAPVAVVAAPVKEPTKPKNNDKGVKPAKGRADAVVVEAPPPQQVVVITKNTPEEPPPRTTVTVTPSQPTEPPPKAAPVKPAPVPAQPAPNPPAAAIGGYFLVNSTPLAAVAQNGQPLGLAQGAKIDVKGATGTIKVGDGGSPFQVSFSYRVTGPGALDISVDSAPWSILKKNGIAVGKTPRPGIAASNQPLRFEFASPAVQGSMTVVLRYFPN